MAGSQNQAGSKGGFFSCWEGIIPVSQQHAALNAEPCHTKSLKLEGVTPLPTEEPLQCL